MEVVGVTQKVLPAMSGPEDQVHDLGRDPSAVQEGMGEGPR